MRSLLRRYREIIFVAAVLGLPFLVFVVRAKKGRTLTVPEQWVVRGMAPVEKAIVLATGSTIDLVQGYVALRGVRADNLALRREALRGRAFEGQLAELKLENERLKRLLDFADRQAPQRLVAARVIATGTSPHSPTLRIARGSRDGLRKGQAVLSPDGIVGTISSLSGEDYADVQLMVSPLAAVPAISQRTRSRSTVKGTGDGSRCKLEYALRTDDLRDGDLLVTAGGPGFYPQGLPVGRLVNVHKARAAGLFQDAEVVPAVDFSRLDEVQVVVEEKRSESAVDLAAGFPATDAAAGVSP